MSAKQLPRLRVVNFVSEADAAELERLLVQDGFSVLRLPGEKVRSAADLYLAASEHLLSGRPVQNWSSFDDALGERLAGQTPDQQALVWTGAHAMLEGGLADLVIALDTLTQRSRRLYERDRTFVTFLLGAGPNFPPLPQAAG